MPTTPSPQSARTVVTNPQTFHHAPAVLASNWAELKAQSGHPITEDRMQRLHPNYGILPASTSEPISTPALSGSSLRDNPAAPTRPQEVGGACMERCRKAVNAYAAEQGFATRRHGSPNVPFDPFSPNQGGAA